jgi:hypothetical protein
LVRKPQAQPSRVPALDGAGEARLLALACYSPPDGRKAWTMKLLADKLVELEVVPPISDETVRRASSDYGVPSNSTPDSPTWRSSVPNASLPTGSA